MFKTRNLSIFGGLLVAATIALAGSLSVGATKATADPQLAHMVYFKLTDNSGANRAKLLAACKLYLEKVRVFDSYLSLAPASSAEPAVK